MAIALILFFSANVFASEMVIFGGSDQNIGSFITGRAFFIAGETPNPTLIPNERLCTIPIAGTFKDLQVNINHARPAGSQWIWTVVKNGINSVLSCTIEGGQLSCKDNYFKIHVNAGDGIYLLVQPNGAANPPDTNAHFSLKFQPDVPNQSFFCSNSDTVTLSSNTSYVSLSGMAIGSILSPTEFGTETVIATAGTLKGLYINLLDSPDFNARTFTLIKNSANTAITCHITGSSTSCTDDANSVSVVAGDTITLRADTNGSQVVNSIIRASIGFTATGTGVWNIPMSSAGSLSQTQTKFVPIWSGNGAIQDLNNTVWNRWLQGQKGNSNSVKITRIQVETNFTGLGLDEISHTFTLMQNGIATGITCDVIDLATTCAETGSVIISDGDLLYTRITPNIGVAKTGNVHISYVGSIVPKARTRIFHGKIYHGVIK